MDITAKKSPAGGAVGAAEVPVHSYRWVILFICWLAYLTVFLQRLTLGPLAPYLKADLALSGTQFGAFVSAAAIGYMVVLLPAGALVDRLGIKWLLVLGQLGGGLIIMSMALVDSFGGGLVVMAASGLGTGLIMPASTKAVMLWFPSRERATAMGLKQTSINGGGILSAMTLPVLAVTWGWRNSFVAVGLFAVLMSILTLLLYREPATGRGPVATAPSLVREAVKVFKGRDIWLVTFAGMALMAVEFSAVSYLVLYLKEGLAIAVVAAGGFLALAQAGGAFGKPLAGLASDRLFGGKRKVAYALMGALSAVSAAALALLGGGSLWLLAPVSFVLGLAAIGWGGLHLTMVSEIAGRELAATVAAFSSFFVMIGNIVGPPAFGYIVDSRGSYRLAWQFLAVLSVVSMVLVLLVREERRRI